MKKFLHINVFLALSGIFSFSNADENERFVYPQAKSDQVNDYFGTKIADPYRPLEDADSEATRKWIEAENTVNFGRSSKKSAAENSVLMVVGRGGPSHRRKNCSQSP